MIFTPYIKNPIVFSCINYLKRSGLVSAKETTDAIAQGAKCLSQAQVSGRIGSLYELFSGKDQCDGSELSFVDRTTPASLRFGTTKPLLPTWCRVLVFSLVPSVIYRFWQKSDRESRPNLFLLLFQCLLGLVLETPRRFLSSRGVSDDHHADGLSPWSKFRCF